MNKSREPSNIEGALAAHDRQEKRLKETIADLAVKLHFLRQRTAVLEANMLFLAEDGPHGETPAEFARREMNELDHRD